MNGLYALVERGSYMLQKNSKEIRIKSEKYFEYRWSQRLAFEKIVSKMAKEFVMLDTVTHSIMNALEAIGTFSGASRAYIFEFQENGIFMDNTYEWTKQGVSAEIENLKNQEIAMFSWWMNRISSGSPLVINDVNQLEDEARAEREVLQMQGILSVLVMPLFKRGKLCGFVGFDNVDAYGRWQEEDMAVLRIASELFSNVFERMAYEAELKKSKEDLEASLLTLQKMQSTLVQQEQMVAIGQLAAGVAHEINNPLAFVLSNQLTLKDYTKKLSHYASEWLEIKSKENEFKEEIKELEYISEDLEDIFEEINSGLHRVKNIVESLRFFSKNGNNQTFEPYDIEEGIRNTLVILHNRLTESVTLVQEIPKGLPLIKAFGSKMNQVFLNLLINALDAVKEKYPLKGGEIFLRAFVHSETIEIQVQDNGNGLSEEVKRQIFNPFFTTKPLGKGTGLGMSVVYDIVKNIHDGDIIIESEESLGTRIRLFFPIIKP